MIGKMHLDKMKQALIDENEFEQFNRYLQKDGQPIQQPFQLSYSKIKINNHQMPVIEEQQQETYGHTRQLTAQQPNELPPQSHQQIKLYLRVIFKFYVTFGNRTNCKLLKSNKFVKLLTDAELIPKVISTLDADILYSQHTKNRQSLDLPNFEAILPQIAHLAYPDIEPQQALQLIYTDNLEVLGQKILQYTDFGQQIQFILEPISEEYIEFIKPIQQQLTKLYMYVFSDMSDKLSKVQWQYIQFLTQSELVPLYMNQSQAQLLFDNINIREPTLQIPEIKGYLFGINHFIESLILISRCIEDMDDISKLILVFDKIESSPGFNKYLKNLSRTSTAQVRLVGNMSKSRLSESKLLKQSNLSQSAQVIKVQITQPTPQKLKQSYMLPQSNRKPLSQTTNRKSHRQESAEVQEYKLYIRIIFKFYASFGNRTNCTLLKSNKFIKILQDAEIVPNLLTSQDADILYSSETKNRDSLNLHQFEALLYKLAQIIYEEENMQKLFIDHFEGMASSILQSTEFGEQISLILRPISQDYIDFLRPIENQLRKLHEFVFADKSDKLSKVQWQYVQFLISCELVPNYINQSQAQLLFDNIGIREPTLKFLEKNGYLFGLNEFVESLILISSTIENMDELSRLKVILFTIEQSAGFTKYLRNLNRTSSDQARLVSNMAKHEQVPQQILRQCASVDQLVPFKKAAKN